MPDLVTVIDLTFQSFGNERRSKALDAIGVVAVVSGLPEIRVLAGCPVLGG